LRIQYRALKTKMSFSWFSTKVTLTRSGKMDSSTRIVGGAYQRLTVQVPLSTSTIGSLTPLALFLQRTLALMSLSSTQSPPLTLTSSTGRLAHTTLQERPLRSLVIALSSTALYSTLLKKLVEQAASSVRSIQPISQLARRLPRHS
jgi:hypothetical protein